MTKSGHIAILGAGPTGLEAALAAADAGSSFTLYEAGEGVGANIRDWGHVRLFSPWAYDVSPRARAALTRAGVPVPEATDPSCPTGAELVERVLAPVAALPAIADRLQTGTRVLEVGRQGLLKHEAIASAARAERPFRLLVEDTTGTQRIDRADVVLDCTGSYDRPNALGDGGIAAPGEDALGDRIERRIPDLERDTRLRWLRSLRSLRSLGRRVLVVGAGHSAMTAVVALAEAAAAAAIEPDAPQSEILWAIRGAEPAWRIDPDDPLPERSGLVAKARALAAGGSPHVRTRYGVVVDALADDGDGVRVTLRATHASPAAGGNGSDPSPQDEVVVDRILALTGSVGDHRIYRQLQVHECYATSGPMKLAAALLAEAGAGGDGAADCLAQESHGVETLTNPEPGFFILGAKSYGRNSSFLMRLGWQQVDEVFAALATER